MISLRIFSCFVVGVSVIWLIPDGKCHADLFQGETFNIAMVGAPADESTFESANPVIQATFFNGVTVGLGQSFFDADVTIELTTVENVIDNVTSQLVISVLGRDASGNLANPFGDGSLATNGTPFTIAGLDLGVFNAAGDTLSPSSGPNPANWTLLAGGFGIVSTESQVGFLQLAAPFSSPPAGISLSQGFNGGSDLAILDLNTVAPNIFTNGGELAGFQFVLNVQSVPEPASTMMVGLLCLGIVCQRRRS